MRALIIEDQKLLQDLVTHVLKEDLGCEIIGSYTDGESGFEAAVKHRPDLVILDMVLPKLGGATILPLLKSRLPEARVVVLSGALNSKIVRLAVAHSVHGLLTKDVTVNTLREALGQIIRGAVYYSPEAFALTREAEPQESVEEVLSNREIEVLQLVGEGYSSKEIAGMLSLSARTVESHRSRIMQKLNLRGATDMARVATQYQLVTREA